MSRARRVVPGTARTCPHCNATILDSASVCPACRHHLRFDAEPSVVQSSMPLRIDGTIRHPAAGVAVEYSIVLAIHDGRGKELSRQVIGVGALRPDDERSVSLTVEVFTPSDGSGSVSGKSKH